jgi:hypothetical protein
MTFNNPSLGFGAISSDQMRTIASRCPHPLLPLLCSSTAPSPIQSLYSIALLSPQVAPPPLLLYFHLPLSSLPSVILSISVSVDNQLDTGTISSDCHSTPTTVRN